MSISREIGRFKKANNLRVVQPARYQDVMNARVDEGNRLGLDPDFTQRIMQAIHEDSVRQQLDIMNDK
jgi:chorismate mutase